MDNTNTERESESEDLNDMDTEILMLDETRQAFYQRENLLMSVDLKAFGVIAVNAVLISVFSYAIGVIKNDWLALPYIFIANSIIFLTKCIWPIEWDRMGAAKIVHDFSNLEYRMAVEGLIANYVQIDELLKIVYKNKYDYFYVGVKMAGLAFISEAVIIALISLQARHLLFFRMYL